MPVYEFECTGCYQVKEQLLGIYEEPETRCECGGFLKKIMSPVQKAIIPYSGWAEDGSPLEDSELKNKAWLESPKMKEEIRSGKRDMIIPSKLPKRFIPEI